MDEEGNQFVAYFLPVEETLRKRKRDQEEEIDYAPEDVYGGGPLYLGGHREEICGGEFHSFVEDKPAPWQHLLGFGGLLCFGR